MPFCRLIWLPPLVLPVILLLSGSAQATTDTASAASLATTSSSVEPSASSPTPSLSSFTATSPPAHQSSSVNDSTVLPTVLSLDEAMRIFRERGLDILTAEAAVRGAEGDERAAGVIQNPQVSPSVGKLFHYNAAQACAQAGVPISECSSIEYSITLSDQNAIEDVISGKRGLRIDVAKKALAAARASRSDTERNVGFMVKSQYMQLVAAKAALDFAEQVQKALAQTVEINRLRYPKVINEGDLARIEAQGLEADQNVDQAVQAYRLAQISLAFLLGVRHGQVPDFAPDDDLRHYHVPNALQATSVAELLQRATRDRPDLLAADYQLQSADAQLRLAQRLRFPDISLDLGYTQTGTGTYSVQPPTLTVGITLTLPIFYQQQGEIRRAEANRDTLIFGKEKAAAQVSNDVETAWASFQSLRSQLARMESRYLERAKRARDITEIQYKAGAATLTDFLDAQRAFIATNVEYFGDLASYWTAVFQIEQAIGTELVK